jgi:uncharacterized protein YraI
VERVTELESQPLPVCTISAPRNVNKRTSPGTNYPVAGILGKGQQAQVDGQYTDAAGNRWWRLTDGSWVRSDIVTEQDDCTTAPQISPEVKPTL